jgi:phosphoribosylamine---glycine ligase
MFMGVFYSIKKETQQSMKIAVIGSGGREHALAWKFAQANGWENVITLPGNGGIPNSIFVDIMDFHAVEKVVLDHKIDLIFVGPEQVLATGIVNHFRNTTIAIFGPTKEAAILESSKVYAKNFMQKHHIATAAFQTFTNTAEALQYGLLLNGNCVVKYDGLAAGKGVFVCQSEIDLINAIIEVEQIYGKEASLIMEQKIVGDEISMIGFTDGKDIKLLQTSQDHKQLLENDMGPNTGGMGAYSPIAGINAVLLEKINTKIINPTLVGIQMEKMDYKGMIYFGIMVEKGEPYLLEYNTRFGDPETEVLLPALKTDLHKIIMACLSGTLADINLEFHDGYFADVVLTAKGYPKKYDIGLEIKGLESLGKDILVFHAGTKKLGNTIITNGGRVLNIVAQGETLEISLNNIYQAIKNIHFEGMNYRIDIGKRKNNEFR